MNRRFNKRHSVLHGEIDLNLLNLKNIKGKKLNQINGRITIIDTMVNLNMAIFLNINSIGETTKIGRKNKRKYKSNS